MKTLSVLDIKGLEKKIIYGTAWKEDLTEGCVTMALNAGCRALDTANQRKHYYEEAVGKALQSSLEKLRISREELFLQTKYTFREGQDHRLPYSLNASISDQVYQSFESSLKHLNTHYLDSYLLHGPSQYDGLGEQDWEAWRAMEDLKLNNKIKYIGVSNFKIEQLRELFIGAKVKPTFIQNRCFASARWDLEIRDFCQKNNMIYQGFSLLTANWKFLGGQIERPVDRNIPQLLFPDKALIHNNKALSLRNDLKSIIQETGKTIQQIIFRFCQQNSMLPITGTRSETHLKEDLNIDDFTLTTEQLHCIENIAFLNLL